MMTAASVTASEFRNDAWVVGLVSLAHGFSHFFQLVLPPLFPHLIDAFGVDYKMLGMVITVFFVVSCFAQTIAGFLVDRFGARQILLLGLVLFGGATALMGLVPSFFLLIPLAALAGLGNSVFHPADFALLNARVGKNRLGRAYGFHAIAGNIGWALAPVASVGLAAMIGWRYALVVLGLTGIAVALALALRPELHEPEAPSSAKEVRESTGIVESLRLLMVTPILMCFGYFLLLSAAMVGLQSFEIPATMMLYGTSIALATSALTGFLIGGSAGILAGGFLADRTTQHHRVAITGIVVASVGVALIATGAVAVPLLVPLLSVVGFFMGATLPSRDLLVRQATPDGASGKTYGFVYSGLDVGAAVVPALFGWLLDNGQPRWVYLLVSAALLLSVVTVANMRPRPVPAVATGD